MSHLNRLSGGKALASICLSGERSQGSSSSGSAHSGGSGGLIDTLGVLGSTGMIIAAARLAVRVAVAAGLHALVVLLSANEVGDRFRILRGIGGSTVTADARIGQSFLYLAEIVSRMN